jgi:hypothetical protein
MAGEPRRREQEADLAVGEGGPDDPHILSRFRLREELAGERCPVPLAVLAPVRVAPPARRPSEAAQVLVDGLLAHPLHRHAAERSVGSRFAQHFDDELAVAFVQGIGQLHCP